MNKETEYNEKKDLDDMMMDNDQMLVNIQKDLLEFINICIKFFYNLDNFIFSIIQFIIDQYFSQN